jgi:O-antigen/teichoic acid export membrane protein
VITYGTNLAVAVLSLVNVLIVARVLGAEGRGHVAFLTAIAWLTSALASAGVEEANANLAASEPRLRRALATNSVVLATLLGALALGVVTGLVAIFPAVAGESSRGLLWLTLGFLPILILGLYLRWFVRADYAFTITNVALLVTPVSNVLVNGALAVTGGLTVGTAIAAWLGGQTVATLLLVWYAARRLAGFGRPNLGLMERTLAFGLKAHAGRVMLLGNWRLDQWLLGAIAGARELGLYSVAVAWAEALWFLPTALKFVQRPYLVRSAPKEAVRQSALAFRLTTLVTVSIAIVMFLAAPVLCVTVFGEDFQGSVAQLRILVFGAFGVVALTVLGNALVAQRQPVRSSVALAAGFACTVALDIVLIPAYGGVGAALASAIAYSVAGGMMIVFFVRALGARFGHLIPTGREAWWFVNEARASRQRRSPSAREDMLPLGGQALSVLAWIAVGTIGGLTIATAASYSTTAALAATVAIGVIVAVVARPALLPMILVSSVFMELLRVEGTTISRVLAPIAALVVFIQLIRGRASVPPGAPLYWVCAYALWALASGFWTMSGSGAAFLLGSLAIAVVYMLSTASLLRTQRDLKQFVWVFALLSLVFGAMSLRHVAEALDVGGVVVEGRAQGGVGDPNFFAATQLVALPLLLVLASQARTRWLQLGLYMGVLVVVASILTSLSRGGLVGLAVLIVMLTVVPSRLLFRSRTSKVVVLTVATIGALAVSLLGSSALQSRIATILDPQQGSGRIELWRAAWTSVDHRPWLGLGYGAFPDASNDLLVRTPGIDLRNIPPDRRGQPVHNTYLESLAELGIGGLVLYLGLLTSTALTLRRTIRIARANGDVFISSCAGALLLGLISWSITSFFLSAETARTFWIIIGLSLALPAMTAQPRMRVHTGREQLGARSSPDGREVHTRHSARGARGD